MGAAVHPHCSNLSLHCPTRVVWHYTSTLIHSAAQQYITTLIHTALWQYTATLTWVYVGHRSEASEGRISAPHPHVQLLKSRGQYVACTIKSWMARRARGGQGDTCHCHSTETTGPPWAAQEIYKAAVNLPPLPPGEDHTTSQWRSATVHIMVFIYYGMSPAANNNTCCSYFPKHHSVAHGSYIQLQQAYTNTRKYFVKYVITCHQQRMT